MRESHESGWERQDHFGRRELLWESAHCSASLLSLTVVSRRRDARRDRRGNKNRLRLSRRFFSGSVYLYVCCDQRSRRTLQTRIVLIGYSVRSTNSV